MSAECKQQQNNRKKTNKQKKNSEAKVLPQFCLLLDRKTQRIAGLSWHKVKISAPFKSHISPRSVIRLIYSTAHFRTWPSYAVTLLSCCLPVVLSIKCYYVCNPPPLVLWRPRAGFLSDRVRTSRFLLETKQAVTPSWLQPKSNINHLHQCELNSDTNTRVRVVILSVLIERIRCRCVNGCWTPMWWWYEADALPEVLIPLVWTPLHLGEWPFCKRE